ncbi:hypothetical protein [Rhizobium sp. BT-175]|uniref:hypothetical protein n=1 Tax=Rhizobium sp. BT-175 TaxID=2986929 RepID=UPI002236378F|nr:hypothetical protein [Rhizobium sp. BT-175]MCV9943010.1 hypothetical protein [Rhizobium sp. BT-175]
MAYLPLERIVIFMGHECARRHMGEEYVVAEARFRQEAKVRSTLAIWADVQMIVPKVRELATALMPFAAGVEAAKLSLAKEAAGFLTFLRDEFLSNGGRITEVVDTGLREQTRSGRRGKKVFDTVQHGTLVGGAFLDPVRPAAQLRRALRHLIDADQPLPVWKASDEDTGRLEDILQRGREVIQAVKQVKATRDYIADARLFLHENNLSLFEKWGELSSSPFQRLSFKRKGSWIFLDSASFHGHHKAAFRVSDDLFKPLPEVNARLFAIKGLGNA